MKKPEAERLVRIVVHDWIKEIRFDQASGDMPSFSNFKNWLLDTHPAALSFRSVMGASDDAEMWFDEELGQTWRN